MIYLDYKCMYMQVTWKDDKPHTHIMTTIYSNLHVPDMLWRLSSTWSVILYYLLWRTSTPARGIEYKLILAALIDSEQMLLSIEAQLCTCRECKSLLEVREFALSTCAQLLQCSTTYVT